MISSVRRTSKKTPTPKGANCELYSAHESCKRSIAGVFSIKAGHKGAYARWVYSCQGRRLVLHILPIQNALTTLLHEVIFPIYTGCAFLSFTKQMRTMRISKADAVPENAKDGKVEVISLPISKTVSDLFVRGGNLKCLDS
jgi:hypothetical protein